MYTKESEIVYTHFAVILKIFNPISQHKLALPYILTFIKEKINEIKPTKDQNVNFSSHSTFLRLNLRYRVKY